MFQAFDQAMMRRALALAEKGLFTTTPNPRVGCVITQGESIVGEGWHEKAGGPHAEVLALQAAGARAVGATVYVNLEPCNHLVWQRLQHCPQSLIIVVTHDGLLSLPHLRCGCLLVVLAG